MAQMTKEEAINHILSINSHVKRKGTSDVWLYDETALVNDRTGSGVRVIKIGINLPEGAELDTEGNIIYGGYTIKVWRT